jgi:hypothetical protein
VLSPENFSLEPTIAKIVPATLGALVSLRFTTGTIAERATGAVGGISLAYYATPATATWLHAATPEGSGLVGFVIGLFGMTLVSKVQEVLQALDAKQAAADIWATAKKRLGLGE